MKNLAILFICLLGHVSFAQTSESIRSGRPGNANAPTTVGKKVLQFENRATAYSDFENQTNVRAGVQTRYGILEKLEVNLATDFSYDQLSGDLGYAGPVIGLTFNWLDGYKDRVALGSILTHNFGSLWDKALNETSLNTLFTIDVTQNFGFCFNGVFAYSAEAEDWSTGLIFNFGYSLPKDNTIYIEGSQYLGTQSNTLFRLGWYKMLNNDLQMDANFRFDQIGGANPTRFYPGVTVGFSKRFNLAK